MRILSQHYKRDTVKAHRAQMHPYPVTPLVITQDYQSIILLDSISS